MYIYVYIYVYVYMRQVYKKSQTLKKKSQFDTFRSKHRRISNSVFPRTSFIYKFKHINKFMRKGKIKIGIVKCSELKENT